MNTETDKTLSHLSLVMLLHKVRFLILRKIYCKKYRKFCFTVPSWVKFLLQVIGKYQKIPHPYLVYQRFSLFFCRKQRIFWERQTGENKSKGLLYIFQRVLFCLGWGSGGNGGCSGERGGGCSWIMILTRERNKEGIYLVGVGEHCESDKV